MDETETRGPRKKPTKEAEVLEFLEKIRQEMRPDLPPLDEQIDGMMRRGMKPRLSIVE